MKSIIIPFLLIVIALKPNFVICKPEMNTTIASHIRKWLPTMLPQRPFAEKPQKANWPSWLNSRIDAKLDDSKISPSSKDLLPQEGRQRPSSGQIPSWSNPPSVPWVDDPPEGNGVSLLPILYLLAPLVVTAMLLPIGATLITAIVMMKAHHQTGQGRVKSLLLREEEIAPMYQVLEKNVHELWQKLEEAIAKYDDGSIDRRKKI
ncbi:uncharacterized protein TNIN_327041 [Trichonephila inaurata madagascariensis]|uniref:Uncharacterized protein n=1 Tax=Trichonephila inaurata madagascariensis TaxID=2747483 RepID=A0A8X6Y5J8_9ARAC|nr:uncharacterized protein TNIN_327041 [Trichonephila inaurata madagascariensis]